MPTQKRTFLTKILIWRFKHISHKHFVYLISIVVGILSGMVAVLIKNGTHFIELLLEGKLIKEYHSAFYFIFPIIGLSITYIIIKYVIRHRLTQGIPATLFSISKKK